MQKNSVEIKPKDGFYIDGVKVNCLKGVKIESGVEELSEVTIKFYADISGLDDLKNMHKFKEEINRSVEEVTSKIYPKGTKIVTGGLK